MLDALRALFRPRKGARTPPVAHETIAALNDRLTALEEIQTRRELEWQETKGQLDRYLRRLTAREQRDREREEQQTTGKPDVGAILGMKFPKRGA